MCKTISKNIIVLIFVLIFAFLLSSCSSKVIKETETFKIISEVDHNLEKKDTIGVSTDDQSALNSFSYKTFKSLYDSNKKENYIYSPASYYMALSLLTEGADNKTLEELLSFQEAKSLESLKSINNALFMNNNYSNKNGKNRIANSYWVDLSLNLKDDYVNTISNSYKGEGFKGLFDSEMADNVCKWINKNTFNFLNVKRTDIDLEDIVLLLINTVYFENKWSVDYKEENTYKQTFYAIDSDVKSDFMHHSVSNKYYSNDKYLVAKDNFYNGNTITYILPNEGYSVDELVESKDFKDLIQDNISYEHSQIRYSLPKFKYQKEYDLKEVSEKLGLEAVFNPLECDLSKISDTSLFVSYIKQIAGIELSEEGVKAAAVTIIGDKATSVGPSEVQIVNLNRPFVYIIRDSANSILFIGVIYNPNK